MIGSMLRRAQLSGDGSTLDLDFTQMSTLADLTARGLTFSRSTSGTFINASGLVATATAGNPRFDYDTSANRRGLLLEPKAINLLQYSTDWSVSPWNLPASIAWDGSTYATAPDGSNTKQITVTSGSSAAIGQAVTTGTVRTLSVWLRAGTLTSFSVGAFDGGGTAWGNNADSTCKIISGPGSVSQQTGGLWLITGLSTTQWTRVQIYRSTTYTTFLAYPGNSSGPNSGTAFMWGMQIESGNGASSLVYTTNSQGTREQDQMQLANLSSIGFSQTAGTMLISGYFAKDATTAAFPRSIRFQGSFQSMAVITNGKTLFGNSTNSTGGAYFESSRALSANQIPFKFAFSLSAVPTPTNAIAHVGLNGSVTTITPAVASPALIALPTSLDFMYSAADPTFYPAFSMTSFKYWPQYKTAAELTDLTT